MGWASATGLFDAAVDVALKFIPQRDKGLLVAAVVEEMYRNVEWDDWDTQDESKYYDDLVHVMHKYGELDENYYEWYTSGRPDDWDWDKKGW